jgi:ornithine decarboxylase
MDNMNKLQDLARQHGTPLIVVDHQVLRRTYEELRRHLPRIKVYYAVKANPDPVVVSTLFHLGACFDVASPSEFYLVCGHVEDLPDQEQRRFIQDRMIYANPVKAVEALQSLDAFSPLVTYDNREEVHKLREHAPHARLVLRIRVPNTGAVLKLSTKFGAPPGEAVDLIEYAQRAGLAVEGISFHVGSQNTNYDNYARALVVAERVFVEARLKNIHTLRLLDIGGGFPVSYEEPVRPFADLSRILNAELDRLFPGDLTIAAEPGRFLVAPAATAVARVIGKTRRGGKPCYYLDDGVYQSFSGIIFDRCRYRIRAFREGPKRISTVYGPTCDSLDTISLSEELPELDTGDLVYSENIGAYSYATATHFNGFSPAKVVHINR